MAANLQQMAAGQMMPQQQPRGNRMNHQQLTQIVASQLMNTPLTIQGWQATLQMTERMGKIVSLITNAILSSQTPDWREAINMGLDYERKAIESAPDRTTYEGLMQKKIAEYFQKRQANEQNLRLDMNNQQQVAQAQAQQAQQAALQAQQAAHRQQQQQLLLNQQLTRAMGQAPQQGFQHLQHPMQVSPIPQQPQQMGMNMGNPGSQIAPNQAQVQMPVNQMRPGGVTPMDLAKLSEPDRAKVHDVAVKLMQGADDNQRRLALATLQQRLAPQGYQSLQRQGKEVFLAFQFQALQMLSRNAQNMRMHQGLPPNANPAQVAAMQLQQQQRPMNPAMVNAVGQQPGAVPAGGFGPFPSNMESIVNEQRQGLIAQQSGQTVVPASSQPGRNPTPQPMTGMQAQNLPNGQQASNQAQRQPQMQPPFNIQTAQQLAIDHSAANRGQAKQLQGQPGGLRGPMPASQSPAMNTLNAPVPQPPVPVTMGQMDSQQAPQGTPQFGQTLDPRFNQRPISITGNINPIQQHPQFQQMLESIPVHQRSKVQAMPPEKLNEVMARWLESRKQHAQQLQQQQQVAAAQMQGRANQVPPGQFNQANAVNQFNIGNPGQPQSISAPPNIPPAMLQQQRSRMSIQNPQQIAMMDSMDLPPQVLTQFHGSLPMEVKKWKDLKAWLTQSQIPESSRVQLNNMQLVQFRHVMQRRSEAAAQAQQQRQMAAGAQPPPGAMPGQPQNVPGAAGPPMIPTHMLQVTPEEIHTLRQQHERLRDAPEDAVRKVAMKFKHDTLMKQLQQMRSVQAANAQQQSAQTQQPPRVNQPENAAAAQAGANQPQQKPNAPVTAPVPAPVPTPATETNNAGVARNRAPSAQNRATASNSSQPAAANARKRPSPDDSGDGPTPMPVSSAPTAPRLPTQQLQLPANMTQEQFAKLTPEQREAFKAQQRQKAAQAAMFNSLQPGPDVINRLKQVGQAVQTAALKEHFPDIPMTAEQKAETLKKLKETMEPLSKIGKQLARFYVATQDEGRTRMFFKSRFRISQQFQDQEKMMGIKNVFSIDAKELDSHKDMLTSMFKDLTDWFKRNGPAPGQGAPPQSQPGPQQAARTAPLSQANLEENTRAHNSMHNRSNSRSGQPPAAPTSTQPPFPLHAASPHGNPSYATKPAVTQDTLQIPPGKRRKTGPQQNAAQSAQAATASPQTKPPSPEVKRQPPPEPKAPPKALLCPEPDCEMSTTAFPNEEAHKAHIEEEHVKPYADPLKFAQDSLAAALGLDSQGRAKPSLDTAVQSGVQGSTAMSASLSKQGQTPIGKSEFSATPMSRAASMNRQGSAAGAKGTPGKNATAVKAEATPKLGESKALQAIAEAERSMLAADKAQEDPWDMSTIDPAALSATFSNYPCEPVAQGAISDFSVYRNAFTPNDTPESSKDSGSSEPNSDISEGAQIDIDLTVWPSDESGLLEEMYKISMKGMDMEDAETANLAQMYFADPGSMPELDMDLSSFWDKPSIQLDPSLYSMDTT